MLRALAVGDPKLDSTLACNDALAESLTARFARSQETAALLQEAEARWEQWEQRQREQEREQREQREQRELGAT